VAEGRVRVNGRIAAAGSRIRSGDRVRIDGRPVFVPAAATCRLILYNKLAGEVTTRRDPEGRRTVFDRLPRLRRERWVAIGRLAFRYRDPAGRALGVAAAAVADVHARALDGQHETLTRFDLVLYAVYGEFRHGKTLLFMLSMLTML